MPDSLLSLEVAIAQGDYSEAMALLDAQPALLNTPFPENIGLTPLMWACRNRRDSMARELLARGAAVDATNNREPLGDGGNTALWFTAQGPMEGTVTIARLLLDHGAQVNTRCEHGTTAFFVAASWVHLDLVQYLLSRGADPLIPNSSGDTPLASLRKNLDWCAEKTSLTPEQRKFQQRAPRMIAFLERVTA